MRDGGEIGDDAFHTLENELDWMEVSDPLRGANADETRRTRASPPSAPFPAALKKIAASGNVTRRIVRTT